MRCLDMFRKSVAIFSLMLFLFTSVISMDSALAAGINSNIALPVRKGGFVFRSQARWLKADDLDVLSFPNVLLFGATPDLSLFAISSLIYRDEEFTDSSGSRVENDDFGLGDTTLLARYTLFSKDYTTGTTRFAVLGGVKLPTGDDDLEPITTDSFDVPLGVVATATWDFRHEVDADIIYRINTEADNFERGDTLSYNLAYGFRVYPWTFPEKGVPNFIYFVAEANGIYSQRSEFDGNTIDNSGGNTLFLSPGIQFLTRRYILEASIQLPVIQDLNGDQRETDFVLVGGIRINF